MPIKSKKSNSKRSTLKHKYKVIKKVKQHLKKKAKKEKKRKKEGKKPKAVKDPGIPSQWPFKEELMKDLEWQKQRIVAQEKAKKEERKKKRAAESEAQMMDDMMTDPVSVGDLQNYANKKQDEYNARKKARIENTSTPSAKEGSRRAYYKEFGKCVTASDVILEVLDARDPLGSRCVEAEKFVRRTGSNKKIILLLNKIDLVPKEVAESWLKYLREELPTVAFKCSTQKQANNLKQRREKGGKTRKQIPVTSATQMSESLGAETLLQLLKNYSRNLDIKTAITVGIVGYPNVGKSSLINSLKRARVANVGNQPGITKSVQQISLEKNINLVDSPGMVYSEPKQGDHWAALRNCIRVEQLDDPKSVVEEIVKRCPQKQLMSLYKVPEFKDSEDFLQNVAFQRGRLLPGGIGDSSSAARVVLHDWHNGKIPYYTLPPERDMNAFQEAEIVDSWREDFNADKVFANEQKAVIGDLPSLTENNGNFFATQSLTQTQLDYSNLDLKGLERDSESDSEVSDDDMNTEEGLNHEIPGLAISGPNAGNLSNSGSKNIPQTKQLYNEIGQFNPLKARAEKKRQKKMKKLSLGEDFNFAEAFADEVNLDGEESEIEEESDEEIELDLEDDSSDSDSD